MRVLVAAALPKCELVLGLLLDDYHHFRPLQSSHGIFEVRTVVHRDAPAEAESGEGGSCEGTWVHYSGFAGIVDLVVT